MAQQHTRSEMWFLDLAKSKIILAFSKSCELVIFFGSLWLTLITVVPNAEGWFSGSVNNFFLITMSFAIDAALPESFLHVVRQGLEQKKTQRRWSIGLAVGMFLLFFANVVYSRIPEAQQAQLTWLISALLIVRMAMGISYVIIRECQDFLDRHEPAQPAIPPAVPDIQALVNQAISDLASKLHSDQQLALAPFSESQNQIQRLFSEVQELQNSGSGQCPEVDYQELARAILPHLRANIDGHVRAIFEESQGQLPAIAGPVKNGSGQQKSGSRSNSQSQQKSGSRASEKSQSEPELKTSEDRLEAAFQWLLQNSIRVSGRALASQARVNRATANDWLSKRQSHSKNGSESQSESGSENGPGSASEPVIEASFVVASEPVQE